MDKLRCAVHMLGARGDQPAVYVIHGYSLCADPDCADAISNDIATTIMNARHIGRRNVRGFGQDVIP